jgi:uncharacterized protein (TIGR02147 family)
MDSIYNFLSYREFLRAYYNERKKNDSFFSYRYMSYKLSIDHSLLVKILLGKRHITTTTIPFFIKLCGLSKREGAYFETLVHYEKARSEKQSRMFFEKLLELKGHHASQVEKYRYEYFQKWYYSAIRSLLDCFDFRDDYKALAAKLNPPISVAEAKTAVQLLEKLNFIQKQPDGQYILTDNHVTAGVTTGEKWEAFSIRDYQKQSIMLSAESVERDPKETRDISSVTMSVDKEAFDDVRQIISECRSAIIRRVDQIPEKAQDRIYQLNMQFIPLSKIEKSDV